MPAPSEHAQGLLFVALFKLSKVAFFAALGAGAFHLRHRDVGNFVSHLVDLLGIDSEGRFVAILMDKADLINSHELVKYSRLSFAYAAVCLVEGTGLLMEKTWAEYFTVVLTTMGLPWEGYELVRHFTGYKVLLLVLNLIVLLYLLWVLKRKRRANPSGSVRSAS